MKYDIAFIGVGKMGGAVCAGACRAFGPERVAAFVRDPARRPAIREQFGCAAVETAAEAASGRRAIAVKTKRRMGVPEGFSTDRAEVETASGARIPFRLLVPVPDASR